MYIWINIINIIDIYKRERCSVNEYHIYEEEEEELD